MQAGHSPWIDAVRDASNRAAPPRPSQPRPIVIVGAGGIVRAAHLPAYAKANLPVLGITDLDAERAAQLAREFGIPRVLPTLKDLVRFAPKDIVYDIAVPAAQLLSILAALPVGAAVLMQKPMGETLDEARAIRDLCRRKHLTAAVNFSFRYAPNNLAARAIVDHGLLGEVHDLEIQVRTYTPWHLWSFLASAPRLAILYHSIHYIDLVRSWMGDPQRVLALTTRNPQSPQLAPTRSTILLDYGASKRVFIATHHSHEFGPRHQQSLLLAEGPSGALHLTMGLNLDYPHGKPDTIEAAPRGHTAEDWIALHLPGNTFPDAFVGTMGALQAFVEGSVPHLPSSVEDAFRTMALVEACYSASEPGTPVDHFLKS